MKRSTTSQTPDSTDDAPTLTQADFDRAEYRVAGKRTTKSQWQAAVAAQVGKKRISIMLDAAVIAHFKAAAGDRGYQTLINDTLRKAVSGESLVTELRLVLREELAAYKVR